jgi:pilus assembly protein Flp/PilA
VIFGPTLASFTQKGILVTCMTDDNTLHINTNRRSGAPNFNRRSTTLSATVSRLYLQTLLTLRDASRRQEGQTMTEYGVLLALIAVVVIASVALLGGKITDVFTNVTGKL